MARTLFQQAEDYIDQLLPARKPDEASLSEVLRRVRTQAIATNDSVQLLAALILQAPRAARAQQQMDKHPHGYHDKQARLYELIDFNDSYVATVLSLPEAELRAFSDRAKSAMDVWCKRMGSRCFSNQQFEAITHGLSREIALFRGVKAVGYDVHMTSRTEDAFGIDMIISESTSHRQIAIDCKTHSAFFYRLEELRHEGRISSSDQEAAEHRGYIDVINRHGSRETLVILWRIDQETYGEIRDFSFVSTVRLAEVLAEIMVRYGAVSEDVS